MRNKHSLYAPRPEQSLIYNPVFTITTCTAANVSTLYVEAYMPFLFFPNLPGEGC